MAEQMKLLGAKNSPYSCRVEIALTMKGVAYELIEQDTYNKSEDLLKYNPVYKKIPVLVHNGKPIAESAIILEYIDETFEGPSILPQDPYQRAQARFWAKFIDEKLFNCLKSILWGGAEDVEKAKEEAVELLKVLEEQLEGRKYFGGEKIGFVDIVSSFVGYWLGLFEEVMEIKIVTKEKLPKLTEWIEDFGNCSPVKECLPPRDPLLQAMRAHFKKA